MVINSSKIKLKAWKVFHIDGKKCAELVFANSRAQAIYTEMKKGNYSYWKSDWPNMRALRRKDLDGFNRQEEPYVEEYNIPGAPKFYREEEQ